MENINEKIKSTFEKVHRSKKLKSHLIELDAKLKTKTKEAKQLKKKLDKENHDVEKLEKLSLSSMFHKILGDKEQQIEIERQEYLQAALLYNACVEEIEKLEYEFKVVNEKQENLSGLEGELKGLMKQKENLLKQSNSTIAFKIIGIDKEVLQNGSIRNEVIEAIQVGKETQQVLKNIHRDLSLTRQWGGGGNAYGRGRYSSYQKRSYIDHARKNAYLANQLLRQFEKEIKDVYQNIQVNLSVDLKMDSFSGFLDAFFNNLITDWIVQQKIQKAIGGIQSVYNTVERYVNQLQQELPILDQNLVELRRAKEILILES